MLLQGNLTALVTPFNKNGSIDFKSLEKITRFQVSNLTDGIVALGSTAEAPVLNAYEKRKILEKIVVTVNGKVPIIAGINSFSLSDAISQVNSRFVDGANALLVSPPPYIKPTDDGLYAFFNTIADSSLVPIILYNIPSRTSVKLSCKLVEKLSKHENIIGIKEASGDLSYAQEIAKFSIDKNFTLVTGNDNLILPMLSINSYAIISVVGNICPKLCSDIINLFKKGKHDEARSLYFKYFNLIKLLSVETNPIPIKYLMSELKMIKPYFKQPLCMPTKKNAIALKRMIQEFSLAL